MISFLFSCNYATCAVPEAYREIFRGHEDAVSSSEGWEPGALNLAQGFAMKLRIPLVHGDVTKLLIDIENDGDARWSRYSLKLPEATRLKVEDRHERPYRTALRQRINEELRRSTSLLHLMIHTHPGSDGSVLLETPLGGNLAEQFSNAWRTRLAAAGVDVRQSKGLVELSPLGAVLSKEFPASHYGQVKLSISQSFFLEGRPWRWDVLKKLMIESLLAVANDLEVSAPESL